MRVVLFGVLVVIAFYITVLTELYCLQVIAFDYVIFLVS